MPNIIAGINMTLDGYCDHTSVNADDELHDHYTDVIRNAGTLVYGRITYQLMEDFWPTLVKQPSGMKSLDEFANAIDRVPKVVFSHTMKRVNWDSARLATRDLREELMALKEQSSRDILIGSRSLIIASLNMQLVDEFQICVHPVIAGQGLRLFDKIEERIDMKLRKTKTLHSSGAVVMYYHLK
jgi:dihydrofolate reductase